MFVLYFLGFEDLAGAVAGSARPDLTDLLQASAVALAFDWASSFDESE
jgi:hypothetical protein